MRMLNGAKCIVPCSMPSIMICLRVALLRGLNRLVSCFHAGSAFDSQGFSCNYRDTLERTVPFDGNRPGSMKTSLVLLGVVKSECNPDACGVWDNVIGAEGWRPVRLHRCMMCQCSVGRGVPQQHGPVDGIAILVNVAASMCQLLFLEPSRGLP